MKQKASDEDVNAFMRAVFPAAPDLAIAAFDEAHVLRTATQVIATLREERDKAIVAGQAQTGVELIAAERQRQIAVKGYTPEHDDAHEGAELLAAAAWYLDNGSEYDFGLGLPPWPWGPDVWKASDDRVQQLTKAGALIAAEIDRIRR